MIQNKIIMFLLYSHVKRQEGNIKLSEYSQEEPDFRVICMLSPLYPGGGLPFETDGDARRLA